MRKKSGNFISQMNSMMPHCGFILMFNVHWSSLKHKHSLKHKYTICNSKMSFHKVRVKFSHAECESGLQISSYMHFSKVQILITLYVAAGCKYCGGYRGVTPQQIREQFVGQLHPLCKVAMMWMNPAVCTVQNMFLPQDKDQRRHQSL